MFIRSKENIIYIESLTNFELALIHVFERAVHRCIKSYNNVFILESFFASCVCRKAELDESTTYILLACRDRFLLEGFPNDQCLLNRVNYIV